MVSDVKIFAQKWSKIAVENKVFYRFFSPLFTPFKRLCAPISQSPMSKPFRCFESLGKTNGKIWSQIWILLHISLPDQHYVPICCFIFHYNYWYDGKDLLLDTILFFKKKKKVAHNILQCLGLVFSMSLPDQKMIKNEMNMFLFILINYTYIIFQTVWMDHIIDFLCCKLLSYF